MSVNPEINENFISEELLNSAASGSALAALISIVSVFCAFAALYGQSDLTTTLIWGGAICIVSAATLVCSIYRHNGQRRLFNLRLHQFLAFCLGVLWGGGLLVIGHSANVFIASVMTVIVVGTCACSVLVQLSNPKAWLLTFAPAICFHAVYLYTRGGDALFQLATITLVYSILMAAVAVRLKNYLHQNIESQYALHEKNEEILDKNARLYKLAHYDGLTGTANRKLLMSAANDLLEEAARNGRKCAFLLIDLDHFKHLNDTMGHAAGDELLMIVGRRLTSCTRNNDIVARIGGDEFGVLVTDLETPEDAEQVASNILASLDKPQQIQGVVLNCRASIGIAYYPRHGVSVTDLMHNADLALQSAKKKGRGKFESCTDDLKLASVRKMTIESELRRALRRGDIGFQFQPIVAAANGCITGVEALVRINPRNDTTANAEDIIHVSSAVGLSDELSGALFDSLEEQGQQLFDTLPDLRRISVNLSPTELRSARPVKRLEEIIARGTLRIDQLQVEITEQSILERGADQARRAIDQLAEMGIPLVMDDFGTGYSSLTHLKSLPISGIKIDKSFVRELNVDQRDAAIVRALAGMCKGLGLKVTAEGVEDYAQFETLRRLGCDYVQGYLFSKAGTIDDLRRLVAGENADALNWARRLGAANPAACPEDAHPGIAATGS